MATKYQAIPIRQEDADINAKATPAKPEDLGYFGVFQGISRDAKLLLLSKSVRMHSFGYLAVLLDIYLQELGFSLVNIGLMFTWTLLGDVLVSILMTSHADRWGRRSTLIASSALAIVTSIIFSTSSNFYILLITAVIGVISPSGSEIGPFMAIEISSLSQVTPDAGRTMLMAWYNLFSCFASASGALCCGFALEVLTKQYGYTQLDSCRTMMLVYSLWQVLVLALFWRLSDSIEPPPTASTVHQAAPGFISNFLGLHKSRSVVLKLSVLFMLDSFGGSFVLQSIISGWFYDVYRTPGSRLGTLVFACNLVAGISALFAAKLADKIGLILTMFVTHLPSNILLIMVPLMPSEHLAILVLICRYSISQVGNHVLLLSFIMIVATAIFVIAIYNMLY